MATREVDYIVYGATGFTGKFVAKRLAQLVREGGEAGGLLRWAIAGRSQAKLDGLSQEIQGDGLPPPHAVIVADTANPDALTAMASKGKVVLNCTGPYRFLGEPVVVGCLEAKTDYIDLCGEPEFMERIFLKYNKTAQEKEVLVVHACAFDSVPADMGVIFTSKQFKAPGGVASIESFLSLHSKGENLRGHLTTFEAAVHGFGSAEELSRIRREVRKAYPVDHKKKVGPPLKIKGGPFFEPRVGQYAFLFPGSDSTVVRSTQRQLMLHGQDPASLPQYAAYFTVPTRYYTGLFALMGGIFQSLAKFQWGRNLLLSAPGLFTYGVFTPEGPSPAEIASTSFAMTFYASGFSGQGIDHEKLAIGPLERFQGLKPDKSVVTRVTGPEPGYAATCVIFTEVARCLVEERASLPVRGGVFTPGAVFHDSTLIERLRKVGIDFAVIEETGSTSGQEGQGGRV